jgi:flagellar motor switch protein FliM
MSQILSQDEVDALLKGISGGKVETETNKPRGTGGLKRYDLTSQEGVVRGRMPVLQLLSDRFSRLMRASLSSAIRKPVSSTVVSNDMARYGDFLKTLSLPTSIHVLKMEPLRGNILIVLESKLVFRLIDVFFGGSGADTYKVEGREFTSIENHLVKKVVNVMLGDLKEAWKSIHPVSFHLVRSEVNPQFVTIVPPDDVVVVIAFELEMENSAGKVSLCFPYSSLEPIKDKLQGGVQSDPREVDGIWIEKLTKQLHEVPVEVAVELGSATIKGKELLSLAVGDIISLNTYSKDGLEVKLEGITKFSGYPGLHRGNQALKISDVVERRY